MNTEFMIIDTILPPCMPFPRILVDCPISSTAKIIYSLLLDTLLIEEDEDENGILFVKFPISKLAAVTAKSTMTVKRVLNELEDSGLIMRVRQGVGKPNRIYILLPTSD